ncbi:maleylpyruvate isomerase family mycothiol-dependent enzyme [Actinoplanes sp. NPDC051633]|uniref:maleylpyruvate isomerase family mycothiol-dependent enzyme n=1 Tax=Actinoplanes sp. NPDC051633 TaxID=3155670 RepID=UPI003443ED13
MQEADYWYAVRAMRMQVADLLASLAPAQWEAPSLCRGWTVRDVAGHLALVPTITTGQMLTAAPRAGFNPHRINTLMAKRRAAADPGDIIAAIRAHAGSRHTAAALDSRDALFDVAVHSQDIAVPLGIDFPVPPEYSRDGLDRVWAMNWPFRARRRLAGRTLRATDTDWTVGSGPEASGPALALLLLLTGRTEAAAPALRQ